MWLLGQIDGRAPLQMAWFLRRPAGLGSNIGGNMLNISEILCSTYKRERWFSPYGARRCSGCSFAASGSTVLRIPAPKTGTCNSALPGANRRHWQGPNALPLQGCGTARAEFRTLSGRRPVCVSKNALRSVACANVTPWPTVIARRVVSITLPCHTIRS